MCNSSGSTTTTSAANPQAQASYTGLMQRANRLSMTPYQAYGGELVAGLNPAQQAGFGQLQSAFGSQQPYMTAAQNYATLGASPLQQSSIDRYFNPYQDQVVKATMNQLQSTEQANNAASMGAGLGAGGLFNDRLGVQQGQLANQEALANAQTLGGLNTQNWQQALAAAQADRNAAAQGAYTFGNLGQENLNSILQGAGATMAAGNQQQQQQQAIDTSGYNQWQIGKAYPYQQIGWAAGIDTGLGSNMGGTSTTTPPAPNQYAPYVGAAMAGAGMAAKANSGGRIPAFADGGAPGIDPDAGASSTPYSVKSYIPTANITHGKGPPAPPSAGQSGQGSQGKGLGGPFGDVTGGGMSSALSGLGSLGSSAVSAFGEAAPEAGAMLADALPLMMLKSGGPVRGFVDGGSPPNRDQGGLPAFDWGDTDPGAFDPEPNVGGADLSGFRPSERNVEMGGIPMPPDKPMHPDTVREELDSSPGLPAFGVPLPQSRGQGSPAVRGGQPDDYNPYTPFPGEGDENDPAGSVRPPGGIDRAYAAANPAERRLLGLGDARAEEGSGRSGALGNALMAAGFGMMANRSPYLGQAIGDAGLAGLGAYQGTKKTEEGQRREQVKEKLDRDKMETQLKRLDDAAKRADRAQGETARHNAATEAHAKELLSQGKTPPGYRAGPNGAMEFIPGGPADPTTIQRTNEAKVGKGMSPEAKEVMARRMIEGDMSGYNSLGRSAAGMKVRDELNNSAAEIIMRERRLNATQAAQYLNDQKQAYGARQIGLNTTARTEGQREANLNMILRATDAAIPAALEANQKLTRYGGPITPLNAIIQKGQIMTSNPELVEFGMANLQLAEHWARAMNPTGVMRESDRDKALTFLDTHLSAGTYERAVRQLEKQITRERDSIHGKNPNAPIDTNRPSPSPGAEGGVPSGGAAQTIPPYPPGVPKGSQYSVGRHMWRTPAGQFFGEQGQAVQ